MNKKPDDLEQSWDLHTALMHFMPFLSLSETMKYAEDLKKYEKPINEIVLQVYEASQNKKTDSSISTSLPLMHKEGYGIHQMLLLATSPSFLPDQSKPREELLKAWNAENDFRPKRDVAEDVTRVALASGALFTLAGAGVVFSLASFGLLKTNPDMLGTASVLSDYNFGLSQNIFDAIFSQKTASKLEAGINTVLTGTTLLGLYQVIKKDKDINLYAKIHASFPDEDIRQKARCELSIIPKNEQYLLTHLTTIELQMFLRLNDDDRRVILTKNPPSLEQRYLSVLSSDKSLFKNLHDVLNVAVTPFFASLPESLTPSTLKSSLRRMRGTEPQNGGVKLKV